MRQKKRVIGLLLICLLTVGIVSVYAQAQGGNPLDELRGELIGWIESIMNDLQNHDDRIITLTARVAELEAECPPGIGPTYTLRTSTKTIGPHGFIEVWSYVKNPSLTIERIYEDGHGPLHNAEVQWINITIVKGNGDLLYECRECFLLFWSGVSNPECPEGCDGTVRCASWTIFYPNGWVGDSFEDVDFGWEYERRWDTTVHPGETALVFYSGWGSAPDSDGMDLGIYQYTYELCVEFEGTTYNLVNTFELNVVEP